MNYNKNSSSQAQHMENRGILYLYSTFTSQVFPTWLSHYSGRQCIRQTGLPKAPAGSFSLYLPPFLLLPPLERCTSSFGLVTGAIALPHSPRLPPTIPWWIISKQRWCRKQSHLVGDSECPIHWWVVVDPSWHPLPWPLQFPTISSLNCRQHEMAGGAQTLLWVGT